VESRIKTRDVKYGVKTLRERLQHRASFSQRKGVMDGAYGSNVLRVPKTDVFLDSQIELREILEDSGQVSIVLRRTVSTDVGAIDI
jgi:hypothetical protein